METTKWFNLNNPGWNPGKMNPVFTGRNPVGVQRLI